MFWTSNFLIGTAAAVSEKIKAFEYEINGAWKVAEIISAGQESQGDAHRVYNYFLLEIPSNAVGTITGLRALDSAGNVIGSKPENIVKSSGTAMIYKFKIRVYEEGK